MPLKANFRFMPNLKVGALRYSQFCLHFSSFLLVTEVLFSSSCTHLLTVWSPESKLLLPAYTAVSNYINGSMCRTEHILSNSDVLFWLAWHSYGYSSRVYMYCHFIQDCWVLNFWCSICWTYFKVYCTVAFITAFMYYIYVYTWPYCVTNPHFYVQSYLYDSLRLIAESNCSVIKIFFFFFLWCIVF